VNFSFYLDIDVIVNNKKNNFKVDLRKGKVILFQFCPAQKARPDEKKLTVEQLQEQVIFM
jgi:hypothetical protein